MSKESFIHAEKQETAFLTILVCSVFCLFIEGTIEMTKERRGPGVKDGGEGYFASVL